MKWITVVRIFLLSTFIVPPDSTCAQNFIADTSTENASLHNAVNLYHRFLSPETGLYNGSEYEYNTYYPFIINEGNPFFKTPGFDTGAVFYNNVLYEKVALSFDIIKQELLTQDPTYNYIIRLNNQGIKWFIISGHTFIRLSPDTTNNPLLHAGFYDRLYNGNTALYEKVSKILKENSASFQGLNRYVVESKEYFIKKDGRYYIIKNKKSLLLLMNNKKKEVSQFIKKNKLNLRKDEEGSLIRVIAFYDSINNNPTPVN